MTILNIYVDDHTFRRLTKAASELGSGIIVMAESAVSEAACGYWRERPLAEDPKDDLRINVPVGFVVDS